jgi:outer membrane protein OmpA-like peptidoglycan-associated protein
MPRTGKCPNYAGCLLAYRNETITLPDDLPFVCPECKLPLIEGGKAGKPVAIPIIIVGGISLLVIMAAGAVWVQAIHLKDQQPSNQIGSSFEEGAIAGAQHEFLPSRHMAVDSPTPDASSTDAGVLAQPPNLDLQNAQNKRVKDEVLKRIDLMPTISEDDKDKLYASVERARQMGKILTISFPSGHVAVSPSDVDQLRAALASAQLQPFTKDPTCVFVILGFADLKGDEKTNLRISTQRAQSVLNALAGQCGILNVMHAVGMGGSTLFGNEQDAERNRVVEVWAVLP